jgi:elongation of very long chain fatty acids protein 6
LAIPILQRLMSNRAAFELKYPLFMWNLGLAVFSMIGVMRVVPSLLYGLAINGPMYFICRNASVGYGRGPLGLWSVLFVLSKYAELVDTLFLILRKKSVPFLHWFHHASVLLISVGTIMVNGPTGIIMIGMNFFVHSIMYSYYAIAAITNPPRWGKAVTTLQIAQMVGGLIMCGGIYYGMTNVENCEVQVANAYGIAFIYFSYLVLFVRFYVERYLTKRDSEAKKAE